MAIPYERIVKEDLALGFGGVPVTMPAGGSATGAKIGLHTFVHRYNVRDFGAVDGQEASAAIQAAIDQAAADTSGTDQKATIYLPGQYRLSTGLVIAPIGTGQTPRISIVGDGAATSILLADPGVTALTLKCGTAGYSDATFERFSIMSGARGIYITDVNAGAFGMTHCAFRHLRLWNLTGAGIYCDSAEILETTFEHVDAELCAYGGQFVGPYLAILTFSNCQWRETTVCGLSLGTEVNSVVLVNNLFESNGRNGLIIDKPTRNGVLMLGGWFENNGTDVSGGPWASCIVRKTIATGAPAFGMSFTNVMLQRGGVNNGNLGVVIEANVPGPIVFNDCYFGGGEGLSTVDVSAGVTALMIRGRQPTIVGTPAFLLQDRHDTGEIVSGGNVTATGNFVAPANSVNGYTWTNRGGLFTIADGYFRLRDNATGDGGSPRLLFGAASASGPLLRRNGTALELMLGDESAKAPFVGGLATIEHLALSTTKQTFVTVTLAAAVTTVVASVGVTAASIVILIPVNGAAALRQAGTNPVIVTAATPGVSFTITTVDGVSAASGTEQFVCWVIN